MDANSTIASCHDFLAIGENLYFQATTGDDPIPFVVEQALYAMLYDDATSQWGHRHTILWTPYTENSGASDREGFVGLGHAHGGFTYDGTYYQNTDMIVMDFFDPCATWNEPTAQPSPTATAMPSPTPSPPSSPKQPPASTPEPTPEPTAEPTMTPPAPSRTVSGRVTENGAALVDVTIASTPGQSTQSDANGDFILPGLAPTDQTLTPSKEGYSFAPASMQIDLAADDLVGIAFAGSFGPAGSAFSYALHLPLVTPGR